MYTTWGHNYDMLEAYGKVLSEKSDCHRLMI